MALTLPLIWLAVGGFLRLFDFGRWLIPAAAWLAPVFLLRAARSADPVLGLLAVWLVILLAACVAYRGVIPAPGHLYPLVAAGLSALWAAPYVVDRLLAPALPGFAATLVFPLAWVAIEFLMARVSPYGAWGALAYTQYGNLPLMQLASVTGLAGITFLVAWFGSSVNWFWEHQFQWQTIQGGALAYTAALAGVLLLGGARLAFLPAVRTVRVAAIGQPKGLLPIDRLMQVLTSPNLPHGEWAALRDEFRRLQSYFLEASQSEARAGAAIVIWPELSVLVFQEDEPALLRDACEQARRERVYILMGIGSLRPGAAKPLENKAVLVDAAGEVVYSVLKRFPAPGWEARLSVRGDGLLRAHASPLGRLASAICYDLDFPHFIRQAARAGVDVLLVPASDWAQIKHLHHVQAVFRAVENGVALVRGTRWGISAVVDPLGRALATLDDSAADRPVMVAQMPITRVPTVYARLGDLFAWLAVAGLLVVMALALPGVD